MAATINRDDAPGHLFTIPELDFSDDLFAERLAGPWVRLGARTLTDRRDERGAEDWVERQCILIPPDSFAAAFDKLESVGNVFHNLGGAGGSVSYQGGKKEYLYHAFHQFEIPFTSLVGEPLVFAHAGTSHVELFINPDLWLYLELEEKTSGSGIWWDPRRGTEALIRRVIDEGNLETVEIRSDYLRKYLQARQMSLVVGHYRGTLLFDPPQSYIEAFVEEEVTLGSPEQGVKAIFQNWGLKKDIPGKPLQRRLHLWFEISPPEIDVDNPWEAPPPFDPYTFTLPTREGPVAPARWKHFRDTEGRTFEGEFCESMNRVFFRQEVLTKYEGASGFEVKDNGSVHCFHYWGLVRSTARHGNDLLSTAIVDFAEGVPFEEWPHWKQYAVEPPSADAARALAEERSVPEAVNSLVDALQILNSAFSQMAASLGLTTLDCLWRGSLESLAGRQLKWIYPVTADDDEFLKRATLASTLVLDALQAGSLRTFLKVIGENLHQDFENPPKTLGSRKLLQRAVLLAQLIEKFQPDVSELPTLIQQAEGKASATEPDLQVELEDAYNRVRDEFAPLAFLYDLRIHGGLAHQPNKERAAAAAAKLGLPTKNWHRTDFLSLLSLVSDSIARISENLGSANIYRVHPAPTGAARGDASQALRRAMDAIGRKLKDVPAAELERELDKALRDVRPGYRSVRE